MLAIILTFVRRSLRLMSVHITTMTLEKHEVYYVSFYFFEKKNNHTNVILTFGHENIQHTKWDESPAHKKDKSERQKY